MKIKIMKTITNLLLSLLLITTASCQEARTVKVTITEEDGTPIKGASATVIYLGYGKDGKNEKIGLTNEQGKFEASGTTSGRMHVRVEKGGYYTTNSDRLSRKKDHDVTYVLRKIKNPIPLYAKRFKGKIPSIGNKHGFDFEVGDWVAPHGKGKQSDLFFKANIVENEDLKFAGKLEITFPHEKEGAFAVNDKNGYLPSSKLVMPNEALEKGYQRKIERIEFGYQNDNKERNTSYFLKTRAQLTEQGDHIFNYSKLGNGIDFMMSGGKFLEEAYRKKHPDELGVVTFIYYFNPTPNDRNLEFNPKQNLFKGLDSMDRVNEP
jgi:hypothetical protein